MKLILAIALGGALGAVGRHLAAHRLNEWIGGGFPVGIMACNIVGSFLMGALVELAALTWSPSAEMRAFLTVGVLGAFTTFSTFSLETVLLIQRGEAVKAALYVGLSVGLSILGLVAGMQSVKAALS
ncbi:MAG: fluoride efflux transporter CrcB [Alphaproteobacteria bacterium]|nr:fluoride efflux transporter CrcB [Alphaproteobacteria bacterium]